MSCDKKDLILKFRPSANHCRFVYIQKKLGWICSKFTNVLSFIAESFRFQWKLPGRDIGFEKFYASYLRHSNKTNNSNNLRVLSLHSISMDLKKKCVSSQFDANRYEIPNISSPTTITSNYRAGYCQRGSDFVFESLRRRLKSFRPELIYDD